jgi:hypothetical protein
MAPLPIHLLWACGSPSSSLGASYVHAGSTMAGYVTCRYSGGYAPTYVPLPTFRYYPGLWSSVSGSPLSVEERVLSLPYGARTTCAHHGTRHTHTSCVYVSAGLSLTEVYYMYPLVLLTASSSSAEHY